MPDPQASDIVIRAALHKHGLEATRDYTMIEAPLPTMAAVLSDKKADLIPAVLPFALNPKLKEEGKVLFEQREAIGITQMIVWTARKSFIDKNRAAMVDFMEDMLVITRWYSDPKNHAELAEIAAKITKQPADRFGWRVGQFTRAGARASYPLALTRAHATTAPRTAQAQAGRSGGMTTPSGNMRAGPPAELL